MSAASREWVRLLVWPSLMSLSYSPPYLPILKRPEPQMLAGIVLLVGVVVAIVLGFRRAPAVAFGSLWFLIALLPVSNIFFVSGVFVAERTLFLPSVGFVLVLGGLLQVGEAHLRSPEARRVITGVVGLLLVAGAMRSAIRQRDWFDTAHLTTAGVRDLPNAYTVDALYGEYLADTRRASGSAEKWLRRAIALYPFDAEVHVELANLYAAKGVWSAAESTFTKAVAIDPKLASARAGLVLCRVQAKDYDGARREAEIGVANGESVDTFKRLLIAIDSASQTAAPR
jgi:hypothetical protein